MFPNLNYAMALRGLLGYQLAAAVGMHESRFSRCLRGRLAFTAQERARIASALNFEECWLFARAVPPRVVRDAEPGVSASRWRAVSTRRG